MMKAIEVGMKKSALLRKPSNRNLFSLISKFEHTQISNIDWSLDGRLICVTIKNENVAVIWNINTCKKVF